MFRLVRSFYSYPKLIQWIISVLVGILAITLSTIFLITLFFPFNFLLIPFVKSATHFSLVPLLRLCGFLNYHSPLFLTVKYKNNFWEIHNGTTFDYVLNMKWAYRGGRAKHITIKNYFEGLLNLINDLKKRNNPKDIELVGTSYFIGRNTIRKIGFSEEDVTPIKRVLFIIDYINLMLMYSFSKGKISFPNILKLRKVKIKGDRLIKAEDKIREYFSMLRKRELASLNV